jgi:hypothetical protein
MWLGQQWAALVMEVNMGMDKLIERSVLAVLCVAVLVAFHFMATSMSERTCFADPSVAGCDAYLEDAR